MTEFEDRHKINFVDTNNVLVGFSNYQDCCEVFGWYYHEDIAKEPDETDRGPKGSDPELAAELGPYVFDRVARSTRGVCKTLWQVA